MEGSGLQTIDKAHIEPNSETPSANSTGAISARHALDSCEAEAYHPSDEDEDAEMSDGGVRIDMDSTHSHRLNNEMDTLDARVVGPYSIPVIPINATFHNGLLTDDDIAEGSTEHSHGEDTPESDDDSAEGFTEHSHGEDTPESDDGILENEEMTVQEEPEGLVRPVAQISDPILEVIQQLQSSQDGQEGSESQSSSMPLVSHLQHNTNEPSSLSSISELLDDQDGLPVLHNALSAVLQGGPSAPNMNIAAQGINLSQVSSDVDWGGHWDSDGDVDDEGIVQATTLQVDDAHALDLRHFLYGWIHWYSEQKSPKKKRKKDSVPSLAYVELLGEEAPLEVRRSDLQGDAFDFQGLDWTKIEVERKEARKMRLLSYRNYTNLKTQEWHILALRRAVIGDGDNYFRFRRMNFKPKIYLSHFQLRNLLACTSKNSVYYAGESKVYTFNPLFDQKSIRMDLRDPVVQPVHPITFQGIQISTIAADHNILVAGGFCGEYGMIALDSMSKANHTEGLITTDMNPITNHVQIHLNRHSGQPQASFASNDMGIRILDCFTNKVVAHHKYNYPINCSAISPDHRLRVIVGDNQNVIIADAEKGDVLQDLSGHLDYGFSCAWSDNGWHVATGNQDRLINIWDARMWTNHSGVGMPIETIACTLTGARSLKFSPLGGGKRVLVAAEAADLVSIIDADSYKSKQQIDFFGEISGVDITPDGQTIFVGITDSTRGGIMEFETCGTGGSYRRKDPYGPTERQFLTDAERFNDSKSRRPVLYRERRVACSSQMGIF